VRQELTSKERDIETGLDYFGARYYANTQGRFTSPDEPFWDQDKIEPQSWNLYSYVQNNPLGFIDPTGRWHTNDKGQPVGDYDGECSDNGKFCWSDKTQTWDKGADKRPITVRDEGPAVVEIFLVSEPPKSRTDLLMAGAVVAVEVDPELSSKVIVGVGAIALKILLDRWSAQSYVPPPKDLPAFPGAKRVRPMTPVPGVPNKKRARWEDNDYIYEWDYQHGTVEKWDKRGNHIGEFDPYTGEQLKPADPSRRIGR